MAEVPEVFGPYSSFNQSTAHLPISLNNNHKETCYPALSDDFKPRPAILHFYQVVEKLYHACDVKVTDRNHNGRSKRCRAGPIDWRTFPAKYAFYGHQRRPTAVLVSWVKQFILIIYKLPSSITLESRKWGKGMAHFTDNKRLELISQVSLSFYVLFF